MDADADASSSPFPAYVCVAPAPTAFFTCPIDEGSTSEKVSSLPVVSSSISTLDDAEVQAFVRWLQRKHAHGALTPHMLREMRALVNREG